MGKIPGVKPRGPEPLVWYYNFCPHGTDNSTGCASCTHERELREELKTLQARVAELETDGRVLKVGMSVGDATIADFLRGKDRGLARILDSGHYYTVPCWLLRMALGWP